MTLDAPGADHPSSEPSLPAGASLGRYAIGRRIGAGGMGEVYEATHRDLGKRVAVKVLRSEFAARPQVRARFAREGVAASRLRHPHVVDVSDCGVHGETPYLVMEYLEGETLEALLAREGALSVARIAAIMLPVCAAVDAAHRAGVVHRDLKPANIFLARTALGDEAVKVLDFGVSKLIDPDRSEGLTASVATLGTAWYMSPEQVLGAREVTPASDQFALATILYECAAGHRPFQGESLYLVMRAITECSPPSLVAARGDLPTAFTDAVARAMARDPARRFSSVAALGAALLAVASEADRARWTTIFDAPAPPLERPAAFPPPSPRRLRAVVLLGVGVLACAGVVALVASRGRARRSAPPVVPAVAPPSPAALTAAPDATPPAIPVRIAPPARVPVAVTRPAAERPVRAPRPRASAAPSRTLGANGAPIEE